MPSIPLYLPNPSPWPGAWRERAACRDTDPNLFFSSKGDAEDFQAARDICAGCAVEVECREYAIDTRQYGIWGGTSEKERKRIRRRRQENARRERARDDARAS